MGIIGRRTVQDRFYEALGRTVWSAGRRKARAKKRRIKAKCPLCKNS